MISGQGLCRRVSTSTRIVEPEGGGGFRLQTSGIGGHGSAVRDGRSGIWPASPFLQSEACRLKPVSNEKDAGPLARTGVFVSLLLCVRIRRGLVTRGVFRISSHQLLASAAGSGAVRANRAARSGAVWANRTAVRRSGAGRGSRSAAAGSSTAALGLVTAVTVLLEPAEQAAVLAGTAAARRSTALSRSRSAAGRSGRSGTSRSTGRGGAGRASRGSAGRVASSRSSAARIARSSAAGGAASAAVQLEQASVSAVHTSTQNESSKGRPLHLESPRLSRGWNAGTSLVVNRPSLRLRPKSATHYSVGPRPEISDCPPCDLRPFVSLGEECRDRCAARGLSQL